MTDQSNVSVDIRYPYTYACDYLLEDLDKMVDRLFGVLRNGKLNFLNWNLIAIRAKKRLELCIGYGQTFKFFFSVFTRFHYLFPPCSEIIAAEPYNGLSGVTP